jgi:hypothetical protein
MGSGTWIRKIRKLFNLSREIVEYTDSVESLKSLEQKYLDEHFHPMNSFYPHFVDSHSDLILFLNMPFFLI